MNTRSLARVMARNIFSADAASVWTSRAGVVFVDLPSVAIAAKILRVEGMGADQLKRTRGQIGQTGLTDEDARIIAKLAWDGRTRFGHTTARYLQNLNA